jgi:hypothetical protein
MLSEDARVLVLENFEDDETDMLAEAPMFSSV